jgi:hypothetical protein
MSALGTKPKATLEGMPPEVMAMIVRATDRNDTPNLTVKDLSSLLPTSRRVRDNAFYAVWQRLFATRRYMLSRASLKNLDNNSKFGGVGLHVRQVVIGPECINSNAASLLALLPKNKKIKWTQQYQSIWRSLVEDQAQFEANNDDISSLSESLMRLDKLENVHIDSFPFVAGAEAWRAACGSGSLLNKLGDKHLDDQYTFGASRVLMNHSSNMFGHYDRVLEALSAIADKPNWTLDISISGLSSHHMAKPINLSSHHWKMACDRVRHIRLSQTVDAINDQPFQRDWVERLMHDCSQLQSLTLDEASCHIGTLSQSTSGDLRHVMIRGGYIGDRDLADFLKVHKNTLESIILEDICLTSIFTPTSENNWIEKFRLMRAMPNLAFVHFSRLTSGDVWNTNHPECIDEDNDANARQVSSSATASRDAVIATLDCTIEKAIVAFDSIYHTSVQVWFPIQCK